MAVCRNSRTQRAAPGPPATWRTVRCAGEISTVSVLPKPVSSVRLLRRVLFRKYCNAKTQRCRGAKEMHFSSLSAPKACCLLRRCIITIPSVRSTGQASVDAVCQGWRARLGERLDHDTHEKDDRRESGQHVSRLSPLSRLSWSSVSVPHGPRLGNFTSANA